ncbi:MAG: peptide ligase PGM1-related protein [Actinomycetota bacterium]|nr:peptide ligase PGM1-related protein [Actinomycetota bacterium]
MKNVGSTRVVLYSLNYADRVLTEIPYVRYSGERSLCYLEDLRQDENNLIIITQAPVEPYALKYHYRDLYRFNDQQIKSANERLTLLSPRSHESLPLDALVLADDEIMCRLEEEVKLGREVSIANFSASPQVEQIASVLGANLDEPDSRLSSRWGGKYGGKEIFLRSGIAMPPGDAQLLMDEASVVAAIHQLALRDRPGPARKAMIKLNDSSWGGAIGNALIDCQRLVRTGDLRDSVELVGQPWNDFVQEISRGGAIVEEYIQDVTSSPSGIGQITADGSVRVRATHDQIVSSGQYWGCRFPASEKWRREIIQAIKQVGQTLAELGLRGTFGVDFVTSITGEIFAVELNLRKVGPSHVLNYVESLVGSPVDLHSMPQQEGSTVHYVHRRLLQPEILRGQQPRAVVERMRRAGLLYQHDTGEGVVLHMLGALSACGYVELTSITTSDEVANAISEAAQEVTLHSR